MSRRSIACAAALALLLPLAALAEAREKAIIRLKDGRALSPWKDERLDMRTVQGPASPQAAPSSPGGSFWLEFAQKPLRLGAAARAGELTFTLARLGRSYVLHLQAEGVASAGGGPGSEDYRNGYGQVRLFLNDAYVGNLNDFVKAAKGPAAARIPLPEGAAKGGLNRLRLQLEGAKGGRFGEVVLHKAALEVSPSPPEARKAAELTTVDLHLDAFPIGDNAVLVREFEVNLPAGARFFAIELEAKGVVPVRGGRDSSFYAQGHYQARVMVNGEFVGNLNEFFSEEETMQEWTPVRLFAPSDYFREGKNVVSVRSDAPVGDNHDDFEVRLLRLEVVR